MGLLLIQMATEKVSCWARLVSHLQELFVGILIVCLVTLSQIQLDFSSDEACACTQCLTEGEEDPWFAERYNHLVPKLLSRHNSQLSPETNKWLQVRRRTSHLTCWFHLHHSLNVIFS